MLKHNTLFSLVLSVFLGSCAYQNNSLLLFPDSKIDTDETPHYQDPTKPDQFQGNISNIPMNNNDRQKLNHIFERTVSFQETVWQNSENRRKYLIILRPVYHHILNSRVCRDAEIIPRTNTKHLDTLFITCCREYNGQWQLINTMERQIEKEKK